MTGRSKGHSGTWVGAHCRAGEICGTYSMHTLWPRKHFDHVTSLPRGQSPPGLPSPSISSFFASVALDPDSSAPQVPSRRTSNPTVDDTWIAHPSPADATSPRHLASRPCSEPHLCWRPILMYLGTFRTLFVRLLSPFVLGFYTPFYTFLLYLSLHCRISSLLVTSCSLSRA